MPAQLVRSLVICVAALSATPGLAKDAETGKPVAEATLEKPAAAVGGVTFRLYQQHLIVTTGSIGPLNGLRLLIDTGSTASVVDDGIARRLGLQTEPSTFVAFGRTVRSETAVVGGFHIGPMVSEPVSAIVTDLSYVEGVRIDAIVGLDVLARNSLGIDYRARTLTFSPQDREDWVAPLEMVGPLLTVRMSVAGQPVRLVVDTGSADVVLFKSRLTTPSRAGWRADRAVQYASGVASLRHVELRRVSLGDEAWDRLDAWALDRLPDGYPAGIDGVLGVRSLGCRRVRFDFERRALGCSR